MSFVFFYFKLKIIINQSLELNTSILKFEEKILHFIRRIINYIEQHTFCILLRPKRFIDLWCLWWFH